MTVEVAKETESQSRRDVSGMTLIRMPEVLKMADVSPSTLDRMMANEGFPLPIRLSSRSKAWILEELEDFFTRRKAEREVGKRPCPEADYSDRRASASS